MVWRSVSGDGTDVTYRAALAAGYTAYIRMDILDSTGVLVKQDLPFVDGSIEATLQSRVARTLRFTVDRSWFPVLANGTPDTTATLSPFGNQVKVYRGIAWGDGSVSSFLVFTGHLDTVSLSRKGDVAVGAYDLAADVIAAGFEMPTNSSAGVKLLTQYQTLIKGALTNPTFGTSDATSSTMPALIWESDRGKALDDVASAAGMIWYPLPDGSFVMRLLPWTKPGQSSALSMSDQDIVTDYKMTVTRQGVANAIVYSAERQGAAGAYAIARDTVLNSPTRYGGPLGRRVRQIQNQVPLTQAQCAAAAKTVLQSSKALTVNFDDLRITPDPSLELGDILTITGDGITSTQCITGFTLPLREGSDMSIKLRAYAPLS